MKNTHRPIFFAASLLLLTILACAIPGQPAAPLPAPTADTSGILSTMVAETVSAAIALTEQAVPTPTLVPTTTPTLTATIAPAAEIIPSGSTLTLQEDGSTLFVDERAGYEITVPAGWLAARIDQQEYRDALFISPDIYKSLLSIKNNDPNSFRLFVIDAQDKHVLNDFFTNINFIWNEQGAVSFENDDDLTASAVHLIEITPGLQILVMALSTTSNGISIGLIDSKSTMKNFSDADIVVFQKQVIFNARTGTVAITVTTVEGLKDAVFAAFDAMLETIKISAQ